VYNDPPTAERNTKSMTNVQKSKNGKLFMLGLPYLANGALLKTAQTLQAPLLFSANAFSVYKHEDGLQQWVKFQTRRLSLLEDMDACLDSAGFVAMRRYGQYNWSVDQYLDLCAAFPWRWFASMDFCVEQELCENRETVLDRISLTIAYLKRCRRAAEERGILDHLMPVIQGWKPNDYARCLEKMPDIEKCSVLGVGSVCRRPVHGTNGVLEIVERIDRELGSVKAKIHLFGVKSDAATKLRNHPRVVSFDSQAYGTRARILSRKGGFSKTNLFLTEIMQKWYAQQIEALAKTEGAYHQQNTFSFDSPEIEPLDTFEKRLFRGRQQLRDLVEVSEAPTTWLNDIDVLNCIACEDDDEIEENLT
jgi:hypothetical protein